MKYSMRTAQFLLPFSYSFFMVALVSSGGGNSVSADEITY